MSSLLVVLNAVCCLLALECMFTVVGCCAKEPGGRGLDTTVQDGDFVWRGRLGIDRAGKPVRVGIWTRRDNHGKKIAEGNFLQGQKHGIWHMWYVNGQQASVGEYNHDTMTGLWVFYDTMGRKFAETTFLNGVKHGPWVNYESTGIVRKGTYLGGVLEGEIVTETESGKVVARGIYRDGIREGEWIEYDNDGNVVRRRYFIRDQEQK